MKFLAWLWRRRADEKKRLYGWPRIWIEYVFYAIREVWIGGQWCTYKGWLEWMEADYDQAWLCVCGRYNEDGLHCDCGCEPPWGCDCGTCAARRLEEYYRTHPEELEWCAAWENYPGELLKGDVDFVG